MNIVRCFLLIHCSNLLLHYKKLFVIPIRFHIFIYTTIKNGVGNCVSVCVWGVNGRDSGGSGGC